MESGQETAMIGNENKKCTWVLIQFHPILVMANRQEEQGTVMKTSNIHWYLLNFTPPTSLSDGEWTRNSKER